MRKIWMLGVLSSTWRSIAGQSLPADNALPYVAEDWKTGRTS